MLFREGQYSSSEQCVSNLNCCIRKCEEYHVSIAEPGATLTHRCHIRIRLGYVNTFNCYTEAMNLGFFANACQSVNCEGKWAEARNC